MKTTRFTTIRSMVEDRIPWGGTSPIQLSMHSHLAMLPAHPRTRRAACTLSTWSLIMIGRRPGTVVQARPAIHTPWRRPRLRNLHQTARRLQYPRPASLTCRDMFSGTRRRRARPALGTVFPDGRYTHSQRGGSQTRPQITVSTQVLVRWQYCQGSRPLLPSPPTV